MLSMSAAKLAKDGAWKLPYGAYDHEIPLDSFAIE